MPTKRSFPADWTIADLLAHFGGISPRRIRLQPPPGGAVERDVTAIHDREDRLYELVDGVLVEKMVGFLEGYIAAEISRYLGNFVDAQDLGIVAGADSTLRLMPGLVRIPDVSFISWDRLPDRRVPAEPIPDLAPDLAVEVLSYGNTPEGMERKLRDYFFAGVQLVWLIDPVQRSAEVYTAPDHHDTIGADGALDGGAVLPGLNLPLSRIFARLGPSGTQRRPRRRKKK
jgi:Uma2 family endonuclease